MLGIYKSWPPSRPSLTFDQLLQCCCEAATVAPVGQFPALSDCTKGWGGSIEAIQMPLYMYRLRPLSPSLRHVAGDSGPCVGGGALSLFLGGEVSRECWTQTLPRFTSAFQTGSFIQTVHADLVCVLSWKGGDLALGVSRCELQAAVLTDPAEERMALRWVTNKVPWGWLPQGFRSQGSRPGPGEPARSGSREGGLGGLAWTGWPDRRWWSYGHTSLGVARGPF